MYPNLRAEMARAGMTAATLSKLMRISNPTLANKLNGKRDFSLEEARIIKKILKCDVPIEELFQRDGV